MIYASKVLSQLCWDKSFFQTRQIVKVILLGSWVFRKNSNQGFILPKNSEKESDLFVS